MMNLYNNTAGIKILSVIAILVISLSSAVGQLHYIDSLKQKLSESSRDDEKIQILVAICTWYNYKQPDSVLYFGKPGIELAKKTNDKKAEITILCREGEAYSSKSNYVTALEIKLQALRKAEALGDSFLVAHCKNYMGAIYSKTEDWSRALDYYRETTRYQQYLKEFRKYIYGQMGLCFYNLPNIDSAFFYVSQSYQLDLKDKTHWTVPYFYMGRLAKIKGNLNEALRYYRQGNGVVTNENLDKLLAYKYLALCFDAMQQQDSSVYYAKMAVNGGVNRSLYAAVTDVGELLVNYYTKHLNRDSILKYQTFLLATKDSLYNQDKVKLIMKMTMIEQQRGEQAERDREKAQEEYETKLKVYGLLTGVAIALIIISILVRNNRQKLKVNRILEQQKTEITSQRDDLDQALKVVRNTQSQLIQREKMASLGELTAGIAHEIQNPLNFVNNFSDVNKEILSELADELEKGNYADAKSIAINVIANEEKINHHGKRADAIVKGMLEHSRQGTGEKELTSINALADEYLKLAYQSLRAKDGSFDVSIKTEFDEGIGKVNMVPQDMGRVLLNIYNNALYAASLPSKGGFSRSASAKIPTVWVSTRKENNKVIISVKDNGPGIPPAIIDKIFQPFFTTKPTGSGTGLGLSLAYDIVKAHGGEIKVNSTEGEQTTFIISFADKYPVQ